MTFQTAWMVLVVVSISLIGSTNADQQKPGSFLSCYDRYKNICHKIGPEPMVNEGLCYDPISGKCTAPVDGVYFFSWTYNTNRGSIAYLGGFMDGKLTAYVGISQQTSAWENTSWNLVINMKKGSQFWIQTFASTTQCQC